MKEATCADRIGEQLKGRLDTFTNLVEASNPSDEEDAREAAKTLNDEGLTSWSDDELVQLTEDDVREEAMTQLHQLPLSVEVKRVVRIDISTGGPADWFEVFVDEDVRDDVEPSRIVYHFADWFDHAETTLDGPAFDAAWDALRHYVEPALWEPVTYS